MRITFDWNDKRVFCLDSDTHDGEMRSPAEVRAQILDGRRKGATRLILGGGGADWCIESICHACDLAGSPPEPLLGCCDGLELRDGVCSVPCVPGAICHPPGCPAQQWVTQCTPTGPSAPWRCCPRPATASTTTAGGRDRSARR